MSLNPLAKTFVPSISTTPAVNAPKTFQIDADLHMNWASFLPAEPQQQEKPTTNKPKQHRHEQHHEPKRKDAKSDNVVHPKPTRVAPQSSLPQAQESSQSKSQARSQPVIPPQQPIPVATQPQVMSKPFSYASAVLLGATRVSQNRSNIDNPTLQPTFPLISSSPTPAPPTPAPSSSHTPIASTLASATSTSNTTKRSKKPQPIFVIGGAARAVDRPNVPVPVPRKTEEVRHVSTNPAVSSPAVPSTTDSRSNVSHVVRGPEKPRKKKKLSKLKKIILTEKKGRENPSGEATATTVPGDIAVGAQPQDKETQPQEHSQSQPPQVPQKAKSKKQRPKVVREYCRQILTDEINTNVVQLLSDLCRFQERLHAIDPVKARMRQRFVCGIREVLRGLRLDWMKCVIMAPNIEQITSPGGLDSVINEILRLCEEKGVEVVFALDRHKLGKAMKRSRSVSVVGVYDLDGVHETMKVIRELARKAREEWLLNPPRKPDDLVKAQTETTKSVLEGQGIVCVENDQTVSGGDCVESDGTCEGVSDDCEDLLDSAVATVADDTTSGVCDVQQVSDRCFASN